MLKSLEGIYRDGKVELLGKPPARREARVIVTFLSGPRSQSKSPKLSRKEAAELRARLAAWEQDWNAPGMEAYERRLMEGSRSEGT
jgi:hypothetical protein